MNILLASSRGGGIEHLMPRDITIISHVMPGANMRDLEKRANTVIPPTHLTQDTTHVYILAGIPDITNKLTKHSRTHHYTECIYTGNPQQTIQDIKDNMRKLEHTIKQKGATPIFCTITNMNIEKYNKQLKRAKKTYTLHHTDNYAQMQEHVNTVINSINNHIRETNRANNIGTPFFHSAIRKRIGTKRKHHYIDNWEGLWDGVHATRGTRKIWAKSLTDTIKHNRGLNKRKLTLTPNDTSDEDEPKRAWKRERHF